MWFKLLRKFYELDWYWSLNICWLDVHITHLRSDISQKHTILLKHSLLWIVLQFTQLTTAKPWTCDMQHLATHTYLLLLTKRCFNIFSFFSNIHPLLFYNLLPVYYNPLYFSHDYVVVTIHEYLNLRSPFFIFTAHILYHNSTYYGKNYLYLAVRTKHKHVSLFFNK